MQSIAVLVAISVLLSGEAGQSGMKPSRGVVKFMELVLMNPMVMSAF
jgi:hypothetical protein